MQACTTSPLFWVVKRPRFSTANEKAAATITKLIRIIAVSRPVSAAFLFLYVCILFDILIYCDL
jgi:hypothetical protein